MPGFPGAAYTRVTCRLCASFQTRACSRAPEPMTSTRITAPPGVSSMRFVSFVSLVSLVSVVSLCNTNMQSKLQLFTSKGRCKHPHHPSAPLPPLRGCLPAKGRCKHPHHPSAPPPPLRGLSNGSHLGGSSYSISGYMPVAPLIAEKVS